MNTITQQEADLKHTDGPADRGDGQTDAWTDRRDGWMVSWEGKRVDRWTGGCKGDWGVWYVDWWMNGWTDDSVNECFK